MQIYIINRRTRTFTNFIGRCPILSGPQGPSNNIVYNVRAQIYSIRTDFVATETLLGRRELSAKAKTRAPRVLHR